MLAESPDNWWEHTPRWATVEEATIAACVAFGPERVLFELPDHEEAS